MDNFTPQDPMQPPMESAAMPADASKPGLLSTPRGRIIVIALGAIAFLVVAGVAIFLVFTFLLGGDDGSGGTPVAPGSSTATGTAGSESTETVPIEPADVSLSEIYTFRDVFEPLIKPSEDTTTPGGSDVPSDTPEAAADTLFLQDIIVQDGVSTAVLVWNGTTYQLAEGGVISGTPWQVLAIHGDTVTMLYGDAQVTLTVGQGISK